MAIVPKAFSRHSGLDQASICLATGFYLSLVPLFFVQRLSVVARFSTAKWSGCGLVGSALGVLTFIFLPEKLASAPWALALGVAAAVVISARAERAIGEHDDSRIVIDEWIGAWLAATGVPHEWGWPLLAAFALFRVFDVIKGPFSPLQHLPGGWGVTMDDVAAGLAAALLLHWVPVLL